MSIYNHNIGLLSQEAFPTNGLISYYRLDETSGTVVNDSVGSYHLYNKDCSIVDAKNNKGLQLAQTLDYISGATTTHAFERTDSWSFSLWFKRSTISINAYVVGNQQLGGVFQGYLMFIGTGNAIQIQIYNNNTTNYILAYTASGAFTDTTNYHHMAWTYDGSSTAAGVKVYLDASNLALTVGKDTLTSSIKNGLPFYLGGYPAADWYSRGIIDEVSVWNRVLSQSEVTKLYNAGSGLFY